MSAWAASRQHGPALESDGLPSPPVVGPDARNPAVRDHDVRALYLAGENIDDLPTGQGEVAGLLTQGDADTTLESLQA